MSGEVHSGEKNTAVLLEEYRCATRLLIHYDRMNWRAGMMVVCCVCCLSASLMLPVSRQMATAGPGSLAALLLIVPIQSIALLIGWLAWYTGHRSLYNLRFETLLRIEHELNLWHYRLPAILGLRERGLGTEETLERLRTERYKKLGYTPEFPTLTRRNRIAGHVLARRAVIALPTLQIAAILTLRWGP